MKKKLLIGSAGLLVLAVAGVLIVPGMIDWNDYKDQITSQAKAATGRILHIDGDIRITLLPAPAMLVENVRLENVEGAVAKDMIRLKSLEARVALGPLLSGEVQVESIKLIEPVIELEKRANGEGNWQLSGDLGSAPVAGNETADQPDSGSGTSLDGGTAKGGSAVNIRMDSVIVERGTLVFRDTQSGAVFQINDLNAELAATSLEGPFETSGTLSYQGLPVGFDVSIGKLVNGRTLPVNAVIHTDAGNSKLKISGAVVELGEKPKFKGNVLVSGDNLGDLATAIADVKLPVQAAQPFQVSLSAYASQVYAEATGLNIRLGDIKSVGKAIAEFADAPKINLELKSGRIDLDGLIALKPPPTKSGSAKKTFNTGKADQSTASVPGKKPSAPAVPSKSEFALPAGVEASLSFVVESLVYRGGLISQLRSNLELVNGEITINQLTAQMPGGSDVALFGFISAEKGVPRLEGEVEAAIGDSRGVARWLGLELPNIPADRFRKLSLVSKFVAVPEEISISDLMFQFDSSRLTGAATLALRERPSFGATVILDRIDLNAYLPSDRAAGKNGSAAQTKSAGSTTSGPTAPKSTANPFAGIALLGGFDANVDATVKTLVYRGTPIKNIQLDGQLYDGGLTLRNLSIDRLAGASVHASGGIKGMSAIPQAKDLTVEIKSADLPRLMRLFGGDASLDAKKMGAVSIKGIVNGSILKPSVGITVSGMGGKATFNGTVSAIPVGSMVKGTVTAKFPSLTRLAGAFGSQYKPAGKIGGVDISGPIQAGPGSISLAGLKGTLGQIVLGGNLAVRLDGALPIIEADIKTGPIRVDAFLPASNKPRSSRQKPSRSSSRSRQTATGETSATKSWPTDPIDLGALKLLNANLSLTSDSISYDRFTLKKAKLKTVLSKGVMQVEQLDGILFGGAFKAQSSVDAGARPRIGINISMANADVDQAVQSAAGKSLASGRLGLKINVNSVGHSVADLVANLDGSGSFAATALDVRAGGKGSAMAGVLDLVVGLNQFGGALTGNKGKQGKTADVSGSFAFDNGVARSNDLKLVSGVGNGQASGMVDLVNWRVDAKGQVNLAQNLFSAILSQKLNTPQSVPFRVFGRLDAPNVNIDTGGALGGLPIPGLDRLMKKKGIGSLLQQVLPGLTGSKTSAPAPAPAPSTGTSSNGQMAPPPPPPGTSTQPAKIRPEDVIRGLFKGFGR